MKRKIKYQADYPRRLYTFFITYADQGAPSIVKFAKSIGVTSADIEKFRKHREFELAFRECSEIRKDYLVDMALSKRYDASLVKFLLTAEFGMGEKEKETADNELRVTLDVIGEVANEA